ncbi:MAG: methyltransferase [Chloroflexota bacterium]|nr:methyltransferase [Chloroflexota bacterium]
MHIVRVVVTNLVLSTLVILAAALALRLDRFWSFSLPEGLVLIAWPLLVGGSLLIIASAYALITRGGAIGAPGDPTSQLVTTGPYRWMRNPIYAGAALLLFAVAFIARSSTL